MSGPSLVLAANCRPGQRQRVLGLLLGQLLLQGQLLLSLDLLPYAFFPLMLPSPRRPGRSARRRGRLPSGRRRRRSRHHPGLVAAQLFRSGVSWRSGDPWPWASVGAAVTVTGAGLPRGVRRRLLHAPPPQVPVDIIMILAIYTSGNSLAMFLQKLARVFITRKIQASRPLARGLATVYELR